MNKMEFINYLENRLSVLNKTERDDIINEYVQHIDNKLSEGLSEKEAVETLGNIEDMVREILSAYNVDPDYDSSEESEINKVVTGVVGKFASCIKGIGDYILGQKAITVLKLVIKAIILFFVLWGCFMIGLFLCDIFAEAVSSVIGIWHIVWFVTRLIYIVIALPTVVYIYIRFLAYNIYGGKNKVKSDNINIEEDIKNKAEKIKMSIGKKNVRVFNKNANYSFGNIINNIVMLAIKILVIAFKACVVMCLIPCVITLIFTIIAFGGLLVMSFIGYPFIGMTIGCLGFNLVGIAIVILIIKLIFFNKREVEKNEDVL